jgi:ribosomal protein S18 acetylase RimI-like enzyme
MSMAIRPGWRVRGLGQRFVTGVLERLKARGIRSVSLLVGSDNRRALKVYTDVGFRALEEREVDPQNGDVLVVMRAVLQEDSAVIELPSTPAPAPTRSREP